jgi:Na+-transporting NADH:ubiquinone oxidoreductase subunit F
MDYATAIGWRYYDAVIMGLVAIILAARSRLVSSGDVTIHINDNPDVTSRGTAGGSDTAPAKRWRRRYFLIFSL